MTPRRCPTCGAVVRRRARTGRIPVYCSPPCRWRRGHDRARARRAAERVASESWTDAQLIAALNDQAADV